MAAPTHQTRGAPPAYQKTAIALVDIDIAIPNKETPQTTPKQDILGEIRRARNQRPTIAPSNPNTKIQFAMVIYAILTFIISGCLYFTYSDRTICLQNVLFAKGYYTFQFAPSIIYQGFSTYVVAIITFVVVPCKFFNVYDKVFQCWSLKTRCSNLLNYVLGLPFALACLATMGGFLILVPVTITYGSSYVFYTIWNAQYIGMNGTATTEIVDVVWCGSSINVDVKCCNFIQWIIAPWVLNIFTVMPVFLIFYYRVAQSEYFKNYQVFTSAVGLLFVVSSIFSIGSLVLVPMIFLK